MVVQHSKNPEVPAQSYRESIFNPKLITGNDELIELVKTALDQDLLTCLTKIRLKDPSQTSILLKNGAVCTKEFLRDTMLRLEMMQQMQPDVFAALYRRAKDPKSVMTDVQKSFAEAWRMGETADLHPPLQPPQRPKMTWKSFWSGATPFSFPSIDRTLSVKAEELLSFSMSLERRNVILAAVRPYGSLLVIVNPVKE